MAIDFMIMPLSRYLSGDFITPAMTFAWEQGVPYSLFGPAGRRDIPKGSPFGGPDAPANRARFVPMLADDLATLAGRLGGSPWDEASNAAPRFHRVDPHSYETLRKDAESRTARAHVSATVFLPASFEVPFDMPVVFERLAGSAPVALRELEADGWTDAASSARDTLIDALRDAVALQLPMIVDA